MPPERQFVLCGDGVPRNLTSSDCVVCKFRSGDTFFHWLSDDEKRRAAAYTSKTARGDFIAGRAGVRFVLSEGRADKMVEVSLSTAGKPFVKGGPFFSITHCAGHVLVAFSGQEVGIDVEDTQRHHNHLALARRFFLPKEFALISAAGASGAEAFLDLWTAKEAMVKLSGVGLVGMNSAVVVGPGHGLLDLQAVFLEQATLDTLRCSVAAFKPFRVLNWFELQGLLG